MTTRVAVVGLGYVGLPLAVAFGRKFDTVGYDLCAAKIESFRRSVDPTGEVPGEDFAAAGRLTFTTDPQALSAAEYIVVAVPTPIDTAHRPDFGPLISASRTAGAHMKAGATVIFESTVYPGATEEVCIPVLEKASGMRWARAFSPSPLVGEGRGEGEIFNVAYSPERINPGDREHTLASIVKVVAADDQETLERVAALYAAVTTAGIHKASSIRVAEAAKVIENTQRDLNIALMNELAIICNRLGIDTLEVLEAAGTKWNFLPFRPGLVGGHCIGVDPYYLTHKAEAAGYHPQVILAGRRINDGMGKYVAEQTLKRMIAAGSPIRGAKVNVLGLTFKENCPDIRNSKAVDVVREFESYGIEVRVHDPVALPGEAREEYGLTLLPWQDLPVADALVVAVAHRQLLEKPIADYVEKISTGGCFIDVKSRFDRQALVRAGVSVWRL